MAKAGALMALMAWLVLGGRSAPAQVAESRADAEAQPLRAQPAVLILRVSNLSGQEGATRRLTVVEPRGLREPPLAAAGQSIEYADDGTPKLGLGYELVRAYPPNPDQRDLRYYVYHVDLNDPGFAERWRELQHAERAERRQARAEWRNDQAWERRKHQLLDAHGQAVEEGVEYLRAGQYREAVISLTRAAELNEGDPACRIHLAQARVALGHDTDAAKVLRRALDLQPKLVPTVLSLEQYYPHEEDFAVQVDALAERVTRNPAAPADECVLLGFMEFQRGWLDEAYAAFRRAARDRPKDRVIQSYLALTKPPGTPTGSLPAESARGKRGAPAAPRP